MGVSRKSSGRSRIKSNPQRIQLSIETGSRESDSMTRRCLTHPVGFNADIELIGCPAHFHVQAFVHEGRDTQPLLLASDPSSRRRPCLRLVLLLVSITMNTSRLSYRGLSPHKFKPVPGVHKLLSKTRNKRGLIFIFGLYARWLAWPLPHVLVVFVRSVCRVFRLYHPSQKAVSFEYRNK